MRMWGWGVCARVVPIQRSLIVLNVIINAGAGPFMSLIMIDITGAARGVTGLGIHLCAEFA